ncbi:hypothetical protein N7475_009145 [Penicillium sp. IBT 31633x]|nr:hypothetical protein N7475_009145 [Penicillium sp. IBT 31633x]
MPAGEFHAQTAKFPEKSRFQSQLEGTLDTVVSLLQSVSNSHESSEALRKISDQYGIANNSVSLAEAAATPAPL